MQLLIRRSFPTGARTIVGCLVIFVSVVIAFYPATKLGFFNDDWWLIANAGRMSTLQYLRYYFDPFVQTIWYRPMHGVLILIEYVLWGSSTDGYHWAQNLVHAANSLLLFALVHQVSKHWRVAFLSALLYAVLFPGSSAVFQVTVHDPLAWLFYLLTLLLWFNYLKTRRSSFFLLAISSFVFALLSKETSATLIVSMFLLEQLMVSEKASLRDLIRRYALFAVILAGYIAIEYRIQTLGHFVNRAGYRLTFQAMENLARYVSLLIWPWGSGSPVVFIGLLPATVLFAKGFFRKYFPTVQVRIVVLLGVQLLLSIAPVIAFPSELFEARYLYAASAISAIFAAILFEWVWRSVRSKWATGLASLGAVMFVMAHGYSTTGAAIALGEANRIMRVPFRDIVQQHPTFARDTYIYFINSPYILKHFAPSMFYLRYGPDIHIGDAAPEWWGTDPVAQPANLLNHAYSFVYYYDDVGKRFEIPVAPSTQTFSTPSLPVRFEKEIQLEGYELTSAQVGRTKHLVVLLYWKAHTKIDKDYTVFVHLVDRNGERVSGEDTQPANGSMPTTTWKIGTLVVDPHVLFIPLEVPPGPDYHLEIGLYYLPTMERLSIIDASNQTRMDAVIIQPISIVE